MNKKDWEQLANMLLDFVLETTSLVETCELLIHWGFNNEQILELGFQEETIDQAYSNMEKGE